MGRGQIMQGLEDGKDFRFFHECNRFPHKCFKQGREVHPSSHRNLGLCEVVTSPTSSALPPTSSKIFSAAVICRKLYIWPYHSGPYHTLIFPVWGFHQGHTYKMHSHEGYSCTIIVMYALIYIICYFKVFSGQISIQCLT